MYEYFTLCNIRSLLKLLLFSDKRDKHRLRVFENRALSRIFGPKRDEVIGENCIVRSFMTCILRQIKLESSRQGG
jgi:hypothetical protein